MIPDLFAHDQHLQKLARDGDPLVALDEAIDWEFFRRPLGAIRPAHRKSPAGRKPFDPVMMFKILVLQSLYNLSDDGMEFQLRDRLSFMRFVGLEIGARIPDAKTIWLFREKLKEAELIEELFAAFNEYLDARGFSAHRGQIVDASLVAAPRQRNTRRENETIKKGETPEAWEDRPAKARQKDTDARWTKKNNINYFGYKNHVSVDREYKLIRRWGVTDAAVHDSRVFAELLDETNSNGNVWADSAYRTPSNFETLRAFGFREKIQRKGVRGRPLSRWEQGGNRTRARVRARIEHVFGAMKIRAGDLIVRTIGIERARCKIGLRNLAYNLDRLRFLRTAAR